MQLSEFYRACAEEFGKDYFRVLLRDHWLARFGSTADEALAAGRSAREVWDALCVELEVPVERRHGRGLREPRN